MTGTATTSPTPMFSRIDADDSGALISELNEAARLFKETTGMPAITVWLHEDWKEQIDSEVGADDFEFITGLTPVYDPLKQSFDHIQVGVPEMTATLKKNGRPEVRAPRGMKKKAVRKPKDKAESAAMPLPPNAGNLWLSFVVDDPGVENMIETARAMAASYIEKVNIEPTHLALHSSFESKASDIQEKTGLTPVFDEPIMAYATWGSVGLRELDNAPLTVKSTNIKEVEFFPEDDEDVGTLFVTYIRRAKRDGTEQPDSVYQYAPVPKDMYQSLLEAESKGAFIAKHIKNNDAIHTEKLT